MNIVKGNLLRQLFYRQHVYSTVKSTETALQELVAYIEGSLNVKVHTKVICFHNQGGL